jgi:hypothetical protein
MTTTTILQKIKQFKDEEQFKEELRSCPPLPFNRLEELRAILAEKERNQFSADNEKRVQYFADTAENRGTTLQSGGNAPPNFDETRFSSPPRSSQPVAYSPPSSPRISRDIIPLNNFNLPPGTHPFWFSDVSRLGS